MNHRYISIVCTKKTFHAFCSWKWNHQKKHCQTLLSEKIPEMRNGAGNGSCDLLGRLAPRFMKKRQFL